MNSFINMKALKLQFRVIDLCNNNERNGMKNAITKELKSHPLTMNNNFKNHELINDLNPHWNHI